MRGVELGAESAGVWTSANARDAGFTRSDVEGQRARRTWHSLQRGVYGDGGVVADARQCAWAAVLAVGGPQRAVAVGRTAARLHGLPLVDDDDPATGRYELEHDDVAVRRALHPRVTLHPRRWPYDAVELGTIAGCPVPSLPRTLWDLRLVLRSDALVCALDAAMHGRAVTRSELQALAAGRRGARGVRVFTRALAHADGRAESPLETLARLALRPVLPDLEPQVPVYDAQARLLANIDLGVHALRLGVEADGATHRGEVSLAADRARERRTGWTFERVTWNEVRQRPADVRERVLATAHDLQQPAA